MSNPTTVNSKQERDILAEFARGRDVSDIATGADAELVNQLVINIAKMDRGRAREAVRAYDAVVDVLRKQTGEQGDPIAGLLDAAERTEIPRLVKQAARIRGAVAELRGAVAAAAREVQLRKDVEQARSAYEQAQSELRRLTSKATRSAASGGATPVAGGKGEHRLIREWAAKTGREVAPRGRIPADVVEAYRKAQGGA